MAFERKDIDKKDIWRTEDIFPSEAAWEVEFSRVKGEIGKLSECAGKLGNAKKLLEFLVLEGELSHAVERLYVYAMLKRDENLALPAFQSLAERSESLYIECAAITSFASPELAALDEKYLLKCASSAEFSDYDYNLREVIRTKKHLLSVPEEKLLAQVGEALGSFSSVFSVLNNVDLVFPEIEVDGEKVRLTHGTYSVMLQHHDRAVRKAAYTGIYKAYKSVTHTIAANYAGNVKAGVFISKARGYSSCLSRALDSDDIPVAVYQNLLRSVGTNLEPLHRYVEYRKQQLGLSAMNMYDMYVPLVEGADIKLTYKDAYQLVCEGLEPLGKDYGALLKSAYKDGWIDVYETENKRSGAYAASVYGVHPFVLLNYQKTTHDVFTIAHEMGHAMHTYMSSANQPYSKASYKIFVAEVASIVNEVLLLKHLMKSAGKKLKKYLLSYYLDMFRTTVFRQTMFAEFEHNAHKMCEEGNPLNSDNLSSMYEELNRKYYGKAVESDDGLIRYEWSRIPHFYSAFYVYKYATGLISAVSIASSILKEGDSAVERYKRFLSAGGSKGCYEILKDAGVDLATDTPFLVAMQEFNDILTELLNA